MSKINFRNLKLKSHEEYLICRTYFFFAKDLIFKLKRKVEKGERNDKMTHISNSKALLKHQFECSTCEWNDSYLSPLFCIDVITFDGIIGVFFFGPSTAQFPM